MVLALSGTFLLDGIPPPLSTAQGRQPHRGATGSRGHQRCQRATPLGRIALDADAGPAASSLFEVAEVPNVVAEIAFDLADADRIEAIQNANAFVYQTSGLVGSPDFAQFIKKPGGESYWLISYGAELHFSQWLEAGDTIDGGEYALVVDDATGTVTQRNQSGA